MSNGLNCVNGLTQLGDPCPYEDLSLGGSELMTSGHKISLIRSPPLARSLRLSRSTRLAKSSAQTNQNSNACLLGNALVVQLPRRYVWAAGGLRKK